MAHKYIIDLTADEQEGLLNLITKGKPTARKVARAHVLFTTWKVIGYPENIF